MEKIDGYSQEYSDTLSHWDGVCDRCGHDYFQCLGNCTCLACNAERQAAEREDANRKDDTPDTVIGVVRQRCGHLAPVLSLGSYDHTLTEDEFRKLIAYLRKHSCSDCLHRRLSEITDLLENSPLTPSGRSE